MRTLWVVVLLGVTSCAPWPRLVPARGVDTGKASADGVSLAASSESWPGTDLAFASSLTPIEVEIQNASEHEVKIDYREFTLENDHGFRYQALDPFAAQVAIERRRPAVVGGFVFGPFWFWPRHHHHHGPWGHLIPFSPWFYAGDWYDEPRPDLVRYGLAEGSLKPTGEVRGVLYFPRATRDTRVLVLQWTPRDALSNQPLRTLEVPFHVVR